MVGKPVGILGASWLATRPWLRGPRPLVSWPVLTAGATVAGIGFTVSLLISSIAFHGRHLAEAKLGVLAAAIVAPLLASVAVAVVRRLPTQLRARQLAGTASEILDLSDDVDPARDHVRGPGDALVTLVEYGDFECPFCGQAESVVRELLDSFGDELRYVWRHLPLNDVHLRAQLAAEASEAAAAQGDFWEIYDILLANQNELEPPALGHYAQQLGLDVERFWDGLRNHQYAQRIAEDVASADASERLWHTDLLHQRPPPSGRLRRPDAERRRTRRAHARAASQHRRAGGRVIAAVVFDLDGVLVDSEQVWAAARKEVAREHGGTWTNDATLAMMGMSSPEWSRYMRAKLHVKLTEQEIADEVVRRLEHLYRERLPLMPGAREAVARLARRWPLGLASSANRSIFELVLELAGLDDCFAATVSAEEVAHGKPAPDVYLAAARRLGASPQECVAVEDSTNGLRAAASAGMLLVAYPNREFPPAPQALQLADAEIASLQELRPELLETFGDTSR